MLNNYIYAGVELMWVESSSVGLRGVDLSWVQLRSLVELVWDELRWVEVSLVESWVGLGGVDFNWAHVSLVEMSLV